LRRCCGGDVDVIVSIFKQKDRKAWTYEFVYQGKTYKGSTGQLTREDAEAFEALEQQRVRRIAAGLGDLRDSPYFQEWAGVYYEYERTRKQVKRPERIDELVRVVLEFVGRRPTKADLIITGAPYHNLRLGDLIVEPRWLDDFEEWMTARGAVRHTPRGRVRVGPLAGSTRNHYRSTLSGMYRVAMLPRYRKVTGIDRNPLIGVPRDRRVRRLATVEPSELLAWIGVASYHVRLAMAIAALAPKLRMENVLALEWETHVDRTLRRIIVRSHKADVTTEAPLVVMVSDQLRAILDDARQRNPGRWVVSYRGARVKSIRGGVRLAAERAGLTYGLQKGVTFHTIRHGMASLFARLDVDGRRLSESERAALMAHSDIETTQGYTHLHPIHELAPLEALSAQLPIVDLVRQPWRRWSKRFAGEEPGGPPSGTGENPE
jgi:integrase